MSTVGVAVSVGVVLSVGVVSSVGVVVVDDEAVSVVSSSSSSSPIKAQEESIRLGTTRAMKNFPKSLLNFIKNPEWQMLQNVTQSKILGNPRKQEKIPINLADRCQAKILPSSRIFLSAILKKSLVG